MDSSNTPLVSIIVVNYNGKKYLQNCFNSLLKVNYPNFELIFVDNGSKDNSVDFIKSNYNQVKILDLKDNLGLALASNKGAEIAKGKYLFFLNNDTIVDCNILNELVKAAESDSKIGACASTVFTYDGKKRVDLGISCDRFGYPCYRLGSVFYPDAALFVRKSVFDEICGFDPKLFLYGEDRDFCWRIWLRGYTIAEVEKASFRHDSACTVVGNNKYKSNIWKRELGERNLIRSMLKNYSLATLTYILLQYVFLSLLELITLFLMGQFKVIRQAYLPAYIWNIKNLGDTWKEHCRINRTRVVSDKFILGKMAKQIGKIEVFRRSGIPVFESKKYKV